MTMDLIPAAIAMSGLALADMAFDLSPLTSVGGVGVVLAWMLWKSEPRLKAIESAVDRCNRTVLMLMLEIERTSPQAKEQATALLKEIEQAQNARGGS
jgi:hypothetical protein